MKNIFIQKREIKEPKLYQAAISFFGLIAVMSVSIIVFKVDPHIPMFIGVMIAAVMAMILGYRWSDIETMMIDGINKAMQSVLIIAIVGMMIGVWILSGTVPTMIYYGLKLLSPSIFFIAAVLICSITSLATGTSWGTIGTMGLALMGIGHGLGMPAGPTAGAIISGAYFGDKMSPLSDTTNLAPAMAGTDVFTHVKYMIKSTSVAYIITLLFFGIYGFRYSADGSADTSSAEQLINGIEHVFNINPILLLPPLLVIAAIALKIPALPGITLGLIAGAALAPIFQGDLAIFDPDTGKFLHNGASFGDIIVSAMYGFKCSSEMKALDTLLTKGGLMGMDSTILMTIIAMMFGGIMEGTKQLKVIIEAIGRFVRTSASLIFATEATCILSNIVMPEQYISILIPGRMYAPAYRERGLHPKCLSNALESAGTVSSPLVPWNTCGMFIAGALGIETITYLPYAIFNYSMIIVTAIMAYLGLVITKMTPDEQRRADAGELV